MSITKLELVKGPSRKDSWKPKWNNLGLLYYMDSHLNLYHIERLSGYRIKITTLDSRNLKKVEILDVYENELWILNQDITEFVFNNFNEDEIDIIYGQIPLEKGVTNPQPQ